jgi:hypothetical protein
MTPLIDAQLFNQRRNVSLLGRSSLNVIHDTSTRATVRHLPDDAAELV